MLTTLMEHQEHELNYPILANKISEMRTCSRKETSDEKGNILTFAMKHLNAYSLPNTEPKNKPKKKKLHT